MISRTHPGIFVAIEGPRGAGKTTLTHHLTDVLRENGYCPQATREPTATPLGMFILDNVNVYKGQCLNLLIAADRQFHLDQQILPSISTGEVALSDRYIASNLVFQRSDGISVESIWNLNKHLPKPDFYIFLDASVTVLHERRHLRGIKDRFDTEIGIQAERDLWAFARHFLHEKGFPIHFQNTENVKPDALAVQILSALSASGLLRSCKRSSDTVG